MTTDPLGSFRDQLKHGIGESRSGPRRRARTLGAATLVALAIGGGWLVAVRQNTDENLVADGPSTTLAAKPARSTTASNPGGTACEVTRPTDPGLAVPDGWPARPPSGIWYGTADLWTVLPADGSSPTPRKSVWWSAKFLGGAVEEKPDIAVMWQRLDKPATTVRTGSPGTNAYTPEEGWFMMAGIDPPSAGCWEVTASYRGTSLSYVYWNPPRLWVQPSPSDTSGDDGTLVDGNVGYDEINNCYFLDRSGQRLPVVWPARTTVSDSGSTITLADGRTIRLGDHVVGGGGYHPIGDVVDHDIPPDCVPASGEVAVFNPNADVHIAT